MILWRKKKIKISKLLAPSQITDKNLTLEKVGGGTHGSGKGRYVIRDGDDEDSEWGGGSSGGRKYGCANEERK